MAPIWSSQIIVFPKASSQESQLLAQDKQKYGLPYGVYQDVPVQHCQ